LNISTFFFDQGGFEGVIGEELRHGKEVREEQVRGEEK